MFQKFSKQYIEETLTTNFPSVWGEDNCMSQKLTQPNDRGTSLNSVDFGISGILTPLRKSYFL